MNTFRVLIQHLNQKWWPKTDAIIKRSNFASSLPQKEAKQTIPQPIMLIIAVVSLTSVFGYRFYNQPRIKEGTVAPETILAKRDASVIDEELTEEQRKAAQTGSVKVLKIDSTITEQITQELDTFLNQVQKMRHRAGPMPFIEDEFLSLPTQRYLRNSSSEEWQAIISHLEETFNTSLDPSSFNLFEDLDVDSLTPKSPVLEDLEKALENSELQDSENPVPNRETSPGEGETSILQNDTNQSETPTDQSQKTSSLSLSAKQAIAELQTYGEEEGISQLIQLLVEIAAVRNGYEQALSEFANPEGTKAQENYKRMLLDLRDETWEKTQEGIRSSLDRILTQGIPEGMPDELKQQAVQRQLHKQIPALTTPLATELLSEMIQPNLVEDKEATKQLAEEAAQEVEPVVYNVEAGEIIVEEGNEINRREFVLLDEFNESLRGIDWHGLIITTGIVTGGIGIFILVKRRTGIRLRCRDRILLTLLSVSTPLLLNFFNQNNLPAVGLLVSSFYNPTLAVTQVTLLTGLSIYSNVASGTVEIIAWENLIAGGIGGVLAAIMAGRLRSREELALLGGGIGLTQGSAYFVITLIGSATAGTIWSVLVPGAAIFGVSGLAWSVVALGISPYLEKVFDLITPIRLAELSNPNRPLLKRLATEAPGTFQHTLFVSSLAEAAARELHGNVELVRAGTLYHDIGKMHDPLGFIENQMGGPNKHDEINNPWESAEIIKKHVSQGLVMARKYNLPKALQDFIPEHQGTILISYFYFQAKQKAQSEGEDVDEADFRYDGPIPQSRETGIVMLADACEAALRSLKDATPETAFNMVNKIFKARWQDNQLVDSGLKREELKTVAEVFVRVWQQYNHQRIIYPKGALEANKR